MLLQCNKIEKYYNGKKVLDGISIHSLLYANSLGDHIYFMKNGKILEQGPPKAFFEKPFSLYAADYF